jgi:hypothetical protein
MPQVLRWVEIRSVVEPETGMPLLVGRVRQVFGVVVGEPPAYSEAIPRRHARCRVIPAPAQPRPVSPLPLPDFVEEEVPEPERISPRPAARLAPVEVSPEISRPAKPAPALRAVASGRSYRVTSPVASCLVVPALAQALEETFEHFAHHNGFSKDCRLDIEFARGLHAAAPGHAEGRAADISAVGGKSLREWKAQWDAALLAGNALAEESEREAALASEQKCNLGYGLYQALRNRGGWRVEGPESRGLSGVVQLFGPWTPEEGPWKEISTSKAEEQQLLRMAAQQKVFKAHEDHIHVAK